MKLQRWRRMVPALAVALLLTAAGCAAGNDGDAAPTDPPSGTTGDDVLVVEAQEYEFNPEDLDAEAGTFTVELRNAGIVEHDFIVEEVDDPDDMEHLLHVLPADLEPILDRSAHVFDDDIRALDQTPEHRVPLLGLEVELHRALVAVEVLKIGAVAPADHVFAHRLRRLDADHVGAPIGEMPHACGTGARERKVKHDDSG